MSDTARQVIFQSTDDKMSLLSTLLTICFTLRFSAHADSAKSYVVGLRTTSNGQNYCSGALISSKYVLTSNKCYPAMIGFSNGPTYEAQYAVIGSKFLTGSDDGETIKVSNRIRHPEFKVQTYEYDFLLLELESASTRTPVTMAPVSGPYNIAGKTTVLGWGTGSSLTTTKMAITRSSVCDGVENSEGWTLCLNRTSSSESCKIDYGSPVIRTVPNGSEFLKGVMVNVSNCQQSSELLKADHLGLVRTWIKSITGR